jgi:hypothetical protein
MASVLRLGKTGGSALFRSSDEVVNLGSVLQIPGILRRGKETLREGDKTHNVHLVIARKRDAVAALQKARQMHTQALLAQFIVNVMTFPF